MSNSHRGPRACQAPEWLGSLWLVGAFTGRKNLPADGNWHRRFTLEGQNWPRAHCHMLAVVNSALRKVEASKSQAFFVPTEKWFLYWLPL